MWTVVSTFDGYKRFPAQTLGNVPLPFCPAFGAFPNFPSLLELNSRKEGALLNAAVLCRPPIAET